MEYSRLLLKCNIKAFLANFGEMLYIDKVVLFINLISMNDTTLLVSQLAGPTMMVFALGMFMNKKHFIKAMKSLDKEPLFIVITGAISMVVGLAIVLNHNVWSTAPEVIVSLIGWLSVVKGAWHVLFPDALVKFVKKLANEGFLNFDGLLALALGGYMSWWAFLA